MLSMLLSLHVCKTMTIECGGGGITLERSISLLRTGQNNTSNNDTRADKPHRDFVDSPAWATYVKLLEKTDADGQPDLHMFSP